MNVINIKEVIKRHINGEASSDDIEVLASAHTFQAINNGKKESIIAKLVEALDDSNTLLESMRGYASDSYDQRKEQIESNKAAIKLAEGK